MNYPLVIYLHGAGAGGTNGFLPLLHRCALMFTRGRMKYHLLMPQEGLGYVYGDEFSEDMGDVINSLPHIDHSRIYITGMSMGGCGAIIECCRSPERYAACLPCVAALWNMKDISGEPCQQLDDAALQALAKTPIWMEYSGMERQVNQQLYEALKERGADVRKTHIKLGGLFGHVVSPLAFSLAKPWAKWIFAQRKEIDE